MSSVTLGFCSLKTPHSGAKCMTPKVNGALIRNKPLAAWLRDDLRRRDFGGTLVVIERLAVDGEDLGVLNYYRGEAYRMRRGEGDLARARDAYLASTAQPDAPAAVWRELGDIRRRDGDIVGAKAAYETYLAKAPQAEDAWLVQDGLSNLGNGT